MLALPAPLVLAQPLAGPRGRRRAQAVALWLLGAVLASPALAGQLTTPTEAQPQTGATSAVSQAAQRLGPLFYTPAERDALVRARQGQADTPLHVSRVTVNGLVKRQLSRSTAWVNGRAVEDGQTLPLAGRVGVGRASVSVNGQALRVGQSYDMMTRERGDLVAPGAVTVKGAK